MDKVADAAALASIVNDSGISYRENSVSWIFTCPRCNKRDKLYLRKKDGRFTCWVCATTTNFKGRAEWALTELLNVPVRDLQARLYGDDFRPTGPMLTLEFTDFFGENDEVPEDIGPLPAMPYSLDFMPMEHHHAKRGLTYLQSRGISLELAQVYGLMYHPQERRIIFPIEVDGRPIGWQARTTEPTEWYDEETREMKRGLKVTTPKGVQRDRVLMFQDRLKGSEHAVLTEGPVDGVKCHLCGGNVVAMGKSMAPGQMEVLHKSGVKRLFLALDPDAAAEVSRLCREFSSMEVLLMQVPKGERVPKDFLDPTGPTKIAKDFGDMSVEGAHRAFLDAKRVNASHSFMAPFVDFMTAKAQ